MKAHKIRDFHDASKCRDLNKKTKKHTVLQGCKKNKAKQKITTNGHSEMIPGKKKS